MIYFVDIDGTICTSTHNGRYDQAEPYDERIKLLNGLHDMGHQIIYWTARGTGTSVNWRELTERQLEEWGARYSALLFGKPTWDVLVDDKAFNADGKPLNGWPYAV